MGKRGAPFKNEADKKVNRMVGFDRESLDKANRLAEKVNCSRALVIRAMIHLSDEVDVIDVIQDFKAKQ